MNITGIRPYEAIGYYSNKIERKDALVETTVEAQSPYLEEPSYLEESRPEQRETSYDYAKKYNPDATYEMKGADSDLSSLDKVTELPKEHKDDALRQYQVFVGGRNRETQQNLAPARQLENFGL